MSNTNASSIAAGIIEYLEKLGKKADLPEIITLLQAYIKTDDTTVRVESALALSEDEKATLTDWVTKHVGETPINFTINPALVGGLRLYIGDQCLDLSVANKLDHLYAK